MNTDLGPIDQRLRRTAGTRSDTNDVLLARIEDALARLDDGRFGYCESCGGRIAIDRLVDDPAAHRCAACDPDKG